ncbi:hypothetical protein ACXHQJ_22965, partial [Vibrio vulnificus]
NTEAVASSKWLLFFLLGYETLFTLSAPNWLNFNSDNYPAKGGVQEGSIGADSAAFSKNRRLWWRLGHPFIFSLPFEGVEFSEMAGIMEKYMGHEIKNLPNIKTIPVIIEDA